MGGWFSAMLVCAHVGDLHLCLTCAGNCILGSISKNVQKVAVLEVHGDMAMFFTAVCTKVCELDFDFFNIGKENTFFLVKFS